MRTSVPGSGRPAERRRVGLLPQRTLMIRRQQLREGGRRLGHAVPLDKVARKHCHGAPQGGFRDRRRPIAHERKAS